MLRHRRHFGAKRRNKFFAVQIRQSGKTLKCNGFCHENMSFDMVLFIQSFIPVLFIAHNGIPQKARCARIWCVFPLCKQTSTREYSPIFLRTEYCVMIFSAEGYGFSNIFTRAFFSSFRRYAVNVPCITLKEWKHKVSYHFPRGAPEMQREALFPLLHCVQIPSRRRCSDPDGV